MPEGVRGTIEPELREPENRGQDDPRETLQDGSSFHRGTSNRSRAFYVGSREGNTGGYGYITARIGGTDVGGVTWCLTTCGVPSLAADLRAMAPRRPGEVLAAVRRSFNSRATYAKGLLP